MCADLDTSAHAPKLQVWACSHRPNQMFKAREVPGGRELYHVSSGKCITKVVANPKNNPNPNPNPDPNPDPNPNLNPEP